MRNELVVKTRTLVGVSDLTIAAPIRAGLVSSLETVTYKSRVKAVLKVLNTSRSSSHEYTLLRTFSDSVERVGQIHSVRIAVIDDKVMLAATFDGNFESYIRVLYRKVGSLLDLVFCNTVGHVGSHDHRYEEWRDWVASVQVETDMFYSTPGLTYDDVQYLQRSERLYRDADESFDLNATALTVASAEARAWKAVAAPPSFPGTPDPAPPSPPPPNLPPKPVQRPIGHLENVKQGMQALAILYRLADWYLPGTTDGDYLQRAAQDLLLELKALDTKTLLVPGDPGLAPVRLRFAKQLAWFEGRPPRQPLRDPAQRPFPQAGAVDLADVQGGILTGYPPGITHGALVLVRFDSAAGAAALLKWLRPKLWWQSAGDQAKADKPLITLAFSIEGLRATGLGDAEIDRLPQEFREGMEARCSLLGDLHLNHPRRWHLPVRSWGDAAAQGTRIEMTAVHAVVQMRIAADGATESGNVASTSHPLHVPVAELAAQPGVQVLAVEAMQRAFQPGADATEHFGFADPVSNPHFMPQSGSAQYYRSDLPLGEALLGHANLVDDAPLVADPLWHNGSFMVLRKMRQFVDRFEQVAAAATAPGGGAVPADVVKTRLMGRGLDGKPIVTPVAEGNDNDFNFDSDEDGAQCPLQAHVRRVNPRTTPERGERSPRIVRRGMSYGPPYDREKLPTEGDNPKERGLYFMAFNASLAEQFEVLQRWLTGGNSTGIASAQSDPIVGVPRPHDTRTVRFNHNGVACRVALDHPLTGTGHPAAPPPITRLEWGLYLFAPSATALLALQHHAAAQAAAPTRPVPWNAAEGRVRLGALRQQSSHLPPPDAALLWKAALEDPEERRLHRSAALWAAVREHHGGVLHTGTPYGVLVADPARVQAVFADDAGDYSMHGHLARMRGSFGEIYLGMDRDLSGAPCEYERLSAATNEAIQQIPAEQTYLLTRELTKGALGAFVDGTIVQTRAYGLPTWELNLDVKEVVDQVLAALCDRWFGLPGTPNSTPFARGGYRWDWTDVQAPLIPGHLTWPSRYIFQPLPGDAVVDHGRRYGRALRTAAQAFVAQWRDTPAAPVGAPPPPPLTQAIFAAFADRRDDDLVARTLVGTLMGFLPTVDGNLRATLNEWLRDGTFWRLRQALGTGAPIDWPDARQRLGGPLCETMQLRPMPELVWRTAARDHLLGGVPVLSGEVVVIAIVSATQRGLEQCVRDDTAVFGGVRKAADQPWRPGMPTHACPGRMAGTAVLLGMLAGLLQAPGTMRPSPAPLSLTFEGMVPKLPASAPEPAAGSP
jgi:Dyp-type peroxidase family